MSVDVSKIKKGDRVKVSLYGLPESDWLKVVRVDPRHSRVMATLPSGWTRWLYSGDEVTAHEPAAPALPDWWGSHVLAKGFTYLILNVAPDGEYYVDHVGTKHRPNDPLWWHGVTVIVDRDGNQPAVSEVKAALANEARAEDYAGRYETSHASRMHAEECLRRTEAERDNWKIAYLNVNDERAEYREERDEARADRDRAQDEYLRHVGLATERADALRRERDEARAELGAFRAEVAKVRDDLAIALPVHDNWVARGTLDHLSAILDGTDQ